MATKKTLRQREKELQLLLATPAGQKELRELGTRYHATDWRPKSASTSVITSILIHERVHGIIVG